MVLARGYVVSLIDYLPPIDEVGGTDIADTDRQGYNPQNDDRHLPNSYARDILFVATNLDSVEADDVHYGYEIMIDVCYRCLDAAYYAWLRDKMTQVRKAHDTGKMKTSLYEELRTRFNVIHEWAMMHIGEDVLLRTVKTTRPNDYVPPSEDTYSAYRKACDDAWNDYQRHQTTQQRSGEAQKLHYALATSGFAGIRSSIIDDVIVIARDDRIILPQRWADKVVFAMAELRLMVGSSPQAVQQIYEVKKMFGGKVVPSDGHHSGSGNQTIGHLSVLPVQQSLFSAETQSDAV